MPACATHEIQAPNKKTRYIFSHLHYRQLLFEDKYYINLLVVDSF